MTNVGLENLFSLNFWLEIINFAFIIFCESKFYAQFHGKTYQLRGI